MLNKDTSMIKRRMTALEFETVRPFLKISDERIEAAYSVLVENKTMREVGERFNNTRQAVDGSVRHVWLTLEKYHESQKAVNSAGILLPPGWEQVTLIAPKRLIDKFRSEIAEESITLNNSTKKTRKK